MTTPIERAAEAITFIRVGPHLTQDAAIAAFQSIDQDELVGVINDRWLTNPVFVADAILEWLTQ